MKKSVICIASASLASGVFASGFGLYEASAPTYALGGTVVGRAYDASANFYNPATLTDLTNITVTVGFITEHPRARIKANGGISETMDPGMFTLPHMHFAVPLPYNFAFGLGLMPEYGLGTAYDDLWTLNFNSTETTVTSFTLNPNLAWKIGDFSVGAGLRWLFFDFEQYSRPWVNAGQLGYQRFHNRLKGDNGMSDIGYQVGVKYDITKNFAVGLVYKTETRVGVDGKTSNTPEKRYMTAAAAKYSGDADTVLHLPQSVTGGFNWDITDDWHLGGAVAWTEWSSIDVLNFNLAGVRKNINLHWNDTWRAAIGPSWDFAKDWTAMCSYVYEMDCAKDQESTMLPAADRHMLSWGLVWRCWRGLELGVTYGLIIMDGVGTHVRDTARDACYYYEAHRGICHAAGLTLTYRF